jgi:hypothetical protein
MCNWIEIKSYWMCDWIEIKSYWMCDWIEIKSYWMCDWIKIKSYWMCHWIEIKSYWMCDWIEIKSYWMWDWIEIKSHFYCNRGPLAPSSIVTEWTILFSFVLFTDLSPLSQLEEQIDRWADAHTTNCHCDNYVELSTRGPYKNDVFLFLSKTYIKIAWKCLKYCILHAS